MASVRFGQTSACGNRHSIFLSGLWLMNVLEVTLDSVFNPRSIKKDPASDTWQSISNCFRLSLLCSSTLGLNNRKVVRNKKNLRLTINMWTFVLTLGVIFRAPARRNGEGPKFDWGLSLGHLSDNFPSWVHFFVRRNGALWNSNLKFAEGSRTQAGCRRIGSPNERFRWESSAPLASKYEMTLKKRKIGFRLRTRYQVCPLVPK